MSFRKPGAGTFKGTGIEQYRESADCGIPAGQPEATPKSEKMRLFHRDRLRGAPTNEDMLAERVSRFRERLLQVEMAASKRSIQAEREGDYDLAAIHRDYGHLCKLVRTNHPVLDEITKSKDKEGTQ